MSAAPMDVKANTFTCGKYALPLGRKTYIMGILNVTSDSFSDGGDFNRPEAAVSRAREMARAGAHIIDIGGESTRPGYEPVPEQEQLHRVLPVVRAAAELGLPVSVDTTLPVVAARCIEAGASIINDVSGETEPYPMAALAARTGAGLVITHNAPVEGDVVDALLGFFDRAVGAAMREGVAFSRICVDPGIGFGKTVEQNIEAMRGLERLRELGLPVLLGVSRKSVIGALLDAPVSDRLEGSLAAMVAGIAHGADMVRVHDVEQSVKAARVADALLR